MISATITLGGANAALDGLPPQVIEAVAKKVRALTLDLHRHIVAEIRAAAEAGAKQSLGG